MKGLLGVLFALALVFTGCTQYIVGFPDDWWNNGGSKPGTEITVEDIAADFVMEELYADINTAIRAGHTDGMTADIFRSRQDALDSIKNTSTVAMSTVLESRDIIDGSIVNVGYIYIVITFDRYETSGNTIIERGSLLFTASGKQDSTAADNKTVILTNYEAETIAPLETVTTIGEQSVTEEVTIAIDSATFTGTAVIPNTEESPITLTDVVVEEPSENSGSSIIIGNTELSIGEVAGVQGGLNGLFAGGFGTVEKPYQISNTRQFLNIGNETVQDLILSGNNRNLHFELTDDIDLTGYSGDTYPVRIISGTLDGKNHTIHTGRSISFIFEYAYEDTTFKDINIQFDEGTAARLFTYPAVSSEGRFTTSEIGSDGKEDKESFFQYDRESINLKFDDVDFYAPGEQYYQIGDNNYAFYISNVLAFDVFYGDDRELNYSSLSNLYTERNGSETTLPDFNITLENCDVEGNFIGGFGASGAAIFTGGQFGSANVKLDNCHFDGNLEGLNVALVVGNASSCTADNLDISNVSVLPGGQVFSYANSGNLTFGNKNSAGFENIAGVVGEYNGPAENFTIEIGTPSANERMTIDNNGETPAYYDIKLFLPSMWWYDSIASANPTAVTNSNTFTIKLDPSDINTEFFYASKVMSKIDADSLGIDCSGATWHHNGSFPYAFVQAEDAYYMIIDYGDLVRRYTEHGAPTSVDSLSKVKNVIILSRDESGQRIGYSKYLSIQD